jgi:hypothetical protein
MKHHERKEAGVEFDIKKNAGSKPAAQARGHTETLDCAAGSNPCNCLESKTQLVPCPVFAIAMHSTNLPFKRRDVNACAKWERMTIRINPLRMLH